MPDPDTISADYTLRPSELAATLKILVEARQPVMVWGAPGCGKSEVAQQVAAEGGRTYYDVRALLLDPVDLRGIPWRDSDNRTRWAPPDFLPPTDSTALYLVNLEELPSGVPMVQAALFQLVRDRKCGSGSRTCPAGRLAHRACGSPRCGPRLHAPQVEPAGPVDVVVVVLEMKVDVADSRTMRSPQAVHQLGVSPRSLAIQMSSRRCCMTSIPSRARRRWHSAARMGVRLKRLR